MNEEDFKRLMAQQFLIYKKLVKIEDKVNGKTIFHSDSLLLNEFNNEVDKIIDKLNE